jgi:hypothetical protein
VQEWVGFGRVQWRHIAGPHCAADLQPNSLPTVSLKKEFDIHASYCFTRASCPPLRLGSLRASRRWTSASFLCFGSSYSLQSKQLQSSAARLCPSLARLRCGRWAAKRGPTAFGFAAWTNEQENLLPLLSNFSLPTSHFRRRFVPKSFGCHPGTAAINKGDRPDRPGLRLATLTCAVQSAFTIGGTFGAWHTR